MILQLIGHFGEFVVDTVGEAGAAHRAGAEPVEVGRLDRAVAGEVGGDRGVGGGLLVGAELALAALAIVENLPLAVLATVPLPRSPLRLEVRLTVLPASACP